MVSKLETAMSSIPTGAPRRVPAKVQGAQYQAAHVPEQQPKDAGLLKAMEALVKVGGDYYNKHLADQEDASEREKNEILRKMTPEQIREAMQRGDLMYHDNPLTMQKLKRETGRMTAFKVDSEVAQMAKDGHFKTREDLDEYRHKALQKTIKDASDLWGFDAGDVYFQEGYNSDIAARNINLYATHDSYLSDHMKTVAEVTNRVNLKSLTDDKEFMRADYSGAAFNAYIKSKLDDGIFASDEAALRAITQGLTDAVSSEGGATLLHNLENEKIKLFGNETTYKELLGKDSWENLKAKANYNEFQLSAKTNEEFQLRLDTAVNTPDTEEAWAALGELKRELNTLQPTKEMTAQRQAIIEAEKAIAQRRRAETDNLNKQLIKEQQQGNRLASLDAAWKQKLAGGLVDIRYDSQVESDATGKFNFQDEIAFADKTLASIDMMQIPDDEKVALKLKYIKNDHKDGAFRRKLDGLVQQASDEWTAAVINGEMPESTPNMDNFRALLGKDSYTMAAMYPEYTDLMLVMDSMDRMGIKPKTLIDQAAFNKGLTPEQKKDRDDKFEQTIKSSKATNYSRLPIPLQKAARSIFDAEMASSGSYDKAEDKMDRWMSQHTVTIGETSDRRYLDSVIPKAYLMVTDNVDSWQDGQRMVENTYNIILERFPEVNRKDISVDVSVSPIDNQPVFTFWTPSGIKYKLPLETLKEQYQYEAAKSREETIKRSIAKTKVDWSGGEFKPDY